MFYWLYEKYNDKRIDLYYSSNLEYALERMKSELSFRNHEFKESLLVISEDKYEYNYGNGTIVIEKI